MHRASKYAGYQRSTAERVVLVLSPLWKGGGTAAGRDGGLVPIPGAPSRRALQGRPILRDL